MTEEEELAEFISLLSPEAKTLYSEAMLGTDARDFLFSDLGRCMVGLAHQDRDEAQEKLKRTLPWRWRRIQQLQNEIVLAERFVFYLRDLFVRGKQAEKVLDESEDDRRD